MSRRNRPKMNQRLILPKFNLPGRRPHWMIIALWGVAGLVVLQMGVFATMAWRHQGARAVAVETVAPQAAQAPAAALPLAPPAPVAAARVAMAAVPADTASDPAPGVSPRRRGRGHQVVRHPARVSRSRPGTGRALARTGIPKASAPAKTDEIDELLMRFK
jgi:hypothetical protein